jgi:endonuclease/exonuclease/phosphatase family metal-dependent hydrolase
VLFKLIMVRNFMHAIIRKTLMFKLFFLLVTGLPLLALAEEDSNIGIDVGRLKVMSFNIWGGGLNENKGIDETVAAIRSGNADIVGLQEVTAEGEVCTAEDCKPSGKSVAAEIAAALGYFCHEQKQVSEANWNNAILSRFPIIAATPNDLGVSIEVNGRLVQAFNIHLNDFPYQPYQLLGIEYGQAPFLHSAEDAILSARQTRGPALQLLFEDLETVDSDAPTFIFGDFNEPSHRDWTARAVEAGTQPMVVRFPTTLALESRGFIDAYRFVYPDEVARPAHTWTPVTLISDPGDHHDRIDYVFVRGNKVSIESAAIIGEKSPEADIVVTPWPSDHRAVTVTVTIPSE